MPSAIQGKNAGFGRNILRPYFISHQAYGIYNTLEITYLELTLNRLFN